MDSMSYGPGSFQETHRRLYGGQDHWRGTKTIEFCSGKYISWQDCTSQMQGTYAKVKYGQHCQTEEPVAIKVKPKAAVFQLAHRSPTVALLTVLMMRHTAV